MGPKKENQDRDVTIFSEDVILPTVILTSSLGFSYYIYKAWFRRIPNSFKIPDSYFKRRTLYGVVTSVGDADNFHFFHTPGGLLAGWGWLRRIPRPNEKGLKGQTIHVRLNGVDAPEAAHFGKPAQPYSSEALEWLRSFILGRKVRILPLSRDQYQRTVAQATFWKLTGKKNVSAEMLKNGCAIVYEAKQGAEFNGNEAWFRKLEAQAKKKRIGMFKHGTKKLVTPGEYKKTYR